MDWGTARRVWLPCIMGAFALGAIFQSKLGPHGVARWAGLVIGIIGLMGVIGARYTLGRSFSVKPKATALVTRGIYSRIRNPIYVSGIVAISGVSIMVWQPYMLALLLVVIPMQILRARKEAAVLEAKFGDEYRAYRQRAWF
jgi:protein-S-isoprenylcysteine O-methyltransferase Ste14